MLVQRPTIGCDGCGRVYGDGMTFENAMSARAAAYTDGWRFPNRVNEQGRTVTLTNDVCPSCQGDWTAPTHSTRGSVTRSRLT